MNKRLHELYYELEIDKSEMNNVPVIKSGDIIRCVNDTLDAVPEVRRIHMRQKVKKTVLVAAMIAVLGASTVFAAVNTDFLRTFFTGDTSYLDEFVQTPMESVTDGKYTLTLEQVLATVNHALVVYSVEALTDEAKEELNSENERGISNFIGMDVLTFGVVDHNSAKLEGLTQREIPERRTDNKRYFALTVDIENENEADFFIRLCT